jgi:hypothetical protein
MKISSSSSIISYAPPSSSLSISSSSTEAICIFILFYLSSFFLSRLFFKTSICSLIELHYSVNCFMIYFLVFNSDLLSFMLSSNCFPINSCLNSMNADCFPIGVLKLVLFFFLAAET